MNEEDMDHTEGLDILDGKIAIERLKQERHQVYQPTIRAV